MNLDQILICVFGLGCLSVGFAFGYRAGQRALLRTHKGLLQYTAGAARKSPVKVRSLWDRIHPMQTHCACCGEQLPAPSRFGLCFRCNAW